MSRRFELRVAGVAEVLDSFEGAWNQLAEGRRLVPLRVLAFADLPLLLHSLTPARWALLERLRADGPLSVYELAKRLRRDYKNVHTDVARLAALGLIVRHAHACVSVDWDALYAELRLAV